MGAIIQKSRAQIAHQDLLPGVKSQKQSYDI